ncbi:MAG: U32 family peptidase [Proteobacteria bacterium]|nr:U32 family peptidase [Pseudomonadota bacterium]
MSITPLAKLTLGPILFHWDAAAKCDFYARIADECPIDTVYIGEVVCSKRTPFFERHLPEVIERLERGGKTVVLSTLAEVVLPRERKMTTELCAQSDYLVEVNNGAGLGPIAGRPHRIGPTLNVYNVQSMVHLASRGADHFTLPAEIPGNVAALIGAAARPIGVGIEVQVFGRAPLALSARCFHARAHGRSKDDCRFVCEADPDGLQLSTLSGGPFLAINGIQTLSWGYVNLGAELDAMCAAGICYFRLMPHRTDMVTVAKIFFDRLAGLSSPDEAGACLSALGLGPFENGFWHGRAGHLYHTEPEH